jgi:hypothetical protein
MTIFFFYLLKIACPTPGDSVGGDSLGGDSVGGVKNMS